MKGWFWLYFREQVVNGHKVTINKTEYNNDDDNVHVRIQVINVAPADDYTENPNAEDVTSKTSTAANDNRESLEDTENEISKQSKEVGNKSSEKLQST